MIQTLSYLLSGIVFGSAAGFLPGPLMALVISETLKHSRAGGIKVALAPLITDLPIVAITVFAISKLSNFNSILAAVSFAGAVFLGYLAYESFKVKGIGIDGEEVKSRSLRKGIITNFLSPHPYLFWFSVGAPTTIKAYREGTLSAVCFIAGFYTLLVGSKIIVAFIAGKSKDFLNSGVYVFIIRILGATLLTFACLFIRDGLKLTGLF